MSDDVMDRKERRADLKVLSLMIAAAVGLLVCPFIFIAVGWLVIRIFSSLTLFQASLLCVASGGLLLLLFTSLIFLNQREVLLKREFEQWADEYAEDNEPGADGDESEEERLWEEKNSGDIFEEPARVGRNVKCPCGSGRKYKNCCLKKERAGHPAAASLKRNADDDELPF